MYAFVLYARSGSFPACGLSSCWVYTNMIKTATYSASSKQQMRCEAQTMQLDALDPEYSKVLYGFKCNCLSNTGNAARYTSALYIVLLGVSCI